MNRKQLRKDVYDIVWATLTQQLKTHICIEEDPEDDKLDDIELNIDIAKYCGTFSWILSREGQKLQIHAHDNGNVSIVIEEQVHRTIVIKLVYADDQREFLTTAKNTITDLIHIFNNGNWHILADHLSPAVFGETDWRELLDLYKKYEVEHPYMCGNITYL